MILKRYERKSIASIIEFFILIYVFITTLINFLNICDVTEFEKWFMQPTFFGPSMLILLMTQYSLISINKEEVLLEKIRPYVMGIAGANIVSTCRLPYCLLLILIIIYFVFSWVNKGYRTGNMLLMALVASIGIEIYSVIFVLSNNVLNGGVKLFMTTIWSEVLFVVVAVIYGGATSVSNRVAVGNQVDIIDYEEAPVEETEVSKKKRRTFKGTQIFIQLKKIYELFCRNQRLVINTICMITCSIIIGVFLVCSITISAGEERVRNSEEEVYILQHSQDTSLVVSLVEDEDGYKITFDKYAGTNNQKLQILDMGDGTFQYIFLEPRLAIELGTSEETGKKVLTVNHVSDVPEQRWNKGFWLGIDGFDMVTRITNDNGTPIFYQTLAQAKDMPKVSIGKKNSCNEYFPM